ncbi:MAG: hypothetical protein KKF00_04105 [Proteobacteria bacterium]|nr:hypothetical protein [Pseudomonadota bacterium]
MSTLNLNETKLAAIPEDYDKLGDITFSSDGRRVFHRAIKKGKHFVVINDKAGKLYEAINDLIVFSPDGKKVAYDGKRGGKEYLVIDGKEVKSYDDVAPAAFSPDSHLVACEVWDKKKNKWFIVVSDGEKEVHRSQAYPDTFRRPGFSPDGRLLIYELGEKNKKRIVFFLDLSKRKIIKKRLYDDPGIAGKFSFSSNFSRIVYEAGKEGKFFLVFQDFVLDEERTINVPDIMLGTIVLSPDGKKIAYVAAKEGKYFLVISPWKSPAQGKESGPYEAVVPAIFSPDSTIVAYHAMKKGKWRSVVGGKEGNGYDGVGDATVFSPDGAKIAYPAMKGSGGGHKDRRMNDGKWFMVISRAGKPTAVKEGPAYDMVVTPVFSPDGKYIAFRARTGTMEKAKRFIVIANPETGKVIKEGPACDEVWPPVFSADGKSAAYGARIGRELWWKVEPIK